MTSVSQGGGNLSHVFAGQNAGVSQAGAQRLIRVGVTSGPSAVRLSNDMLASIDRKAGEVCEIDDQ